MLEAVLLKPGPQLHSLATRSSLHGGHSIKWLWPYTGNWTKRSWSMLFHWWALVAKLLNNCLSVILLIEDVGCVLVIFQMQLLLFFVKVHLWLYAFLLYHFSLLCCAVAAFACSDLTWTFCIISHFVTYVTLFSMFWFAFCIGCECVIFSVGFPEGCNLGCCVVIITYPHV